MILLEDISYELREVVNAELDPGETLQWVAQPRPGRMLLKSLPIVLFGIPWTAFAIFWTWGAAGGVSEAQDNGGPGGLSFFPLFGIPFILIGLAMLSSPLFTIRKTRKTVYIITDRRAILFEGGWGMKVRSFRPEQLMNLERKQRSDGSGDIILEKRVSYDNDNKRQLTEVGFFGIENVKEVEDMLESLQAKQ